MLEGDCFQLGRLKIMMNFKTWFLQEFNIPSIKENKNLDCILCNSVPQCLYRLFREMLNKIELVIFRLYLITFLAFFYQSTIACILYTAQKCPHIHITLPEGLLEGLPWLPGFF